MKIKKLLIANRGEIALRIIRSAKKLKIKTVAIYTEADKNSPHVKQASEAYPVSDYLGIKEIVDIASNSKTDAIHPGYGFLSENHRFSAATKKAGIIFIGPSPDSLKLLGSKEKASKLANKLGISIPEGGLFDRKTNKLAQLRFPLLIKASAGGGGKAIRIVRDPKELNRQIQLAKSEAKKLFLDPTLLVEEFIEKARHIEVQILADNFGNVIHLFERECSTQRRRQKIIEEAPVNNLDKVLRKKLQEAAIQIARASKLTGAATVEFLVRKNDYFFLEVNPRIQVEHPVTEFITRLDIVELQIKIAEGKRLALSQNEIKTKGHAIEARVYTEVPDENFRPATGKITHIEGLDANSKFTRTEHALGSNTEITADFDPMIAKVICWGKTREDARNRLTDKLSQLAIHGVETNLGFLKTILKNKQFIGQTLDTNYIERNLDKLCNKKELYQTALILFLLASLSANNKPIFRRPSFPDCESKLFSLSKNYLIKRNTELQQLTAQINSFLQDSNGELEQLRLSIENKPFLISNIDIRNNVAGFSLGNSNYFGSFSKPNPFSNNLTINISGRQYEISKNLDSKEEEKNASSAANQIDSPLPGTILTINAKIGEKIKAGTILLVVESMKMEHSLTAPRDTVVSEIMVKKSQKISLGETLIKFKK